MKWIVANILFFLSATIAVAGSVNIVGNAPTFKNVSFKIEYVSDFLTQTKEPIGASKTDVNGHFSYTFQIEHTSLIFVDFGKVKRTFFVEPNKNYNIEITPIDKRIVDFNGFLAVDVKPAVLHSNDTTELNFLIDKIDNDVATFFTDQGKRLLYGNSTKIVAGYVVELDSKYGDYKNRYFRDYLKYTIGELESLIYKNNPDYIFQKYFVNQPVRSRNLKYISLLKNTFRGYVRYHVSMTNKNVFDQINSKDYSKALLAISPGIPFNKKLCELVLLRGFLEMQNDKMIKEDAKMYLIDKIVQSSPDQHIQTIAKNMKGIIFHLHPGTRAPNISIKNKKISFDLEDYKGKYVYLSFFKAWDATYQEEMEKMNYLNTRYEDKLKIVSIATDVDTGIYNSFRRGIDYNWDIMHFDFNNQLMLDYRIEDIRIENYEQKDATKWILIGPDGSIIYHPAKSPKNGFETEFKKLIEG